MFTSSSFLRVLHLSRTSRTSLAITDTFLLVVMYCRLPPLVSPATVHPSAAAQYTLTVAQHRGTRAHTPTHATTGDNTDDVVAAVAVEEPPEDPQKSRVYVCVCVRKRYVREYQLGGGGETRSQPASSRVRERTGGVSGVVRA